MWKKRKRSLSSRSSFNVILAFPLRGRLRCFEYFRKPITEYHTRRPLRIYIHQGPPQKGYLPLVGHIHLSDPAYAGCASSVINRSFASSSQLPTAIIPLTRSFAKNPSSPRIRAMAGSSEGWNSGRLITGSCCVTGIF